MPDDVQLGSEGIWLSQDTYRNLNADLFKQDARSVVGDTMEQHLGAVAPDMVAQAQEEQAQRQAAIDEQRRQQDEAAAQAQRDQLADQFETSVPDLLSRVGGWAVTPPEAPQGTPADQAPSTPPDTAQATPAPAAAAPPPNPDLLDLTKPAPVAPNAPLVTPAPTGTAAQHPIAVAPATPTTVALSGGVSDARLTPAALQTLNTIGQIAQQYVGADGARAAQAVGLTEGALTPRDDGKDVGDHGASFGWAQLFRDKGQLPAFAADMGMNQDAAGQYARQHPEVLAEWALSPTGTNGWQHNGYLGNAIRAGQQAGLQGADLATYAQQHGQVSVSPERAGQNYNSLFGPGGQAPIAGAASGPLAVVQQAVDSVVRTSRPSQFGVGLSQAEAEAACGPVAAMVFARATGQNPTAEQAVDLARQVGWKPGQGMAGPASELDLLKNMGVPAHLESGADWGKVATDVQNGNPVIISTAGHYFVADGFDSSTGTFHMAKAEERDLRAGAEWMSPDQMQRAMGSVQATLYLDRQPGDGPSVAAQHQTAPAAGQSSASTGAGNGLFDRLQQLGPAIGSAIGDAFKNVFGGANDQSTTADYGNLGPSTAPGAAFDPFARVQSPTTGNPVVDAAGTAMSALGTAVQAGTGVLRDISPASAISRSVAGQEQIASENSALYQQLAGLMQQYRDAKDRGDTATVAALAVQIQPLEDQWNSQVASQVDDRSQLMAAAERNPNLPFYEGGLNLATGAAGATIAAGADAPLAVRAAATAVDPQGQLPGRVLEGIGHLASPVETDVARAVDTPLSLTPIGAASSTPAGAPLAGVLDAGPLSLTPTITRGAVGGGLAGGYQASQQPDATFGDIAAGTLEGASIGAVRGGAAAVTPGAARLLGPVARAIEERPSGILVPGRPGAGVEPGTGILGPSGDVIGHVQDLAAELHPRIQELLGDHPEYARVAQQGLDDLVQSGADPAALGRYWAGVQNSAGVPTSISATDWFRALRTGAMAGGLQTLTHVGLSIPLQVLWSVPRETIAATLRGTPEQIPATIAGTFKGFAAGWEALTQQMRYGITEAEAATGDISRASKSLLATNPLEAGAYRALEGLVSTHGLGQMLLENVGFYQKLTQQAWTMAKTEGLAGSAFTQRVADIVQNAAVDPKYQDMLKEAVQYGQRMSFRGAQGKLGEAARGFADAGIAGNLLIPFETIAYKVLTQGVERTPLGLLGTAVDVARARTPLGPVLGTGPYVPGGNPSGSVTPLTERLANNVLGLGMLAAGLEAASQGLVTGAGPENPTERRTWLDQGNQPDSFLIGGRYVSSHTLGPAAYPFQVAAAAVEAARYAKPGTTSEQVMADGLRRMGQYLTNETWLRSVAQISDALSAQGGAGNKLARLAANYGESFVPQSALLHNVEQATDPYVRQPTPGDIGQQLESYYPGTASEVPERQSLLGESVQNPNQGLGVLAPTARGRPDQVVQLFADAGLGVPNPPSHVQVTSKYSTDLTPDEQRTYQQLRGIALRGMLGDVAGDREFAAAPIEKRQQILQRAMTKADDLARRQLLEQIPNDELERRVLQYQGQSAPRPFPSSDGIPVGPLSMTPVGTGSSRP